MSEWIAIVDDDVVTLRSASLILSKNHMRVTALHSGAALLDWIGVDNKPDLILLDVLMPGLDGFETLKKLREQESKNALQQTPVIFLTGDSDTDIETKCLRAGALDFIRKPFEANALVQRVKNIVMQRERMQQLAVDSEIDRMTGFLNKTVATEKIRDLCATQKGVLIIVDLDSFKLVNDLYGHDMGDRVLIAFSEIVKAHIAPEDVVGRIGGDEFLFFCTSISERDGLFKLIETFNEELKKEAKTLMGDNMKVPLGVSAGGIFVPHENMGYAELFTSADRALYQVKQNDRHGCRLGDPFDMGMEQERVNDIRSISLAMAERSDNNHAMWIGEDAFREIYRFMLRYIQSYRGVAYQVLFTLQPPKDSSYDNEMLMSVYYAFGHILQNTLRKSDIMMQNSPNQFFLLLPELEEQNVEQVMSRIDRIWEENPDSDKVKYVYELQIIEPEKAAELRRRYD